MAPQCRKIFGLLSSHDHCNLDFMSTKKKVIEYSMNKLVAIPLTSLVGFIGIKAAVKLTIISGSLTKKLLSLDLGNSWQNAESNHSVKKCGKACAQKCVNGLRKHGMM